MSVAPRPRPHRRALVTAGATAAITALAALGVAAPALASTPTPTVTPATEVATTTRPLPPQIRALLLARADRAAHRTSTRLAGGFRAVPGSTVSTDLPSRVEIGGSTLQLPFHTTVSGPTTGYTDPDGVVGLVLSNDVPLELVLDMTPGQQRFGGVLSLLEGALPGFATGYWETGITPDAAEGGSPSQIADVPVTVKLHSLLAQRVTRTGSSVEVFAATKTYAGDDRYRPAAGRTVYVQRYTANGWRTLRTLTADSAGHVDARIDLPYRVAVRVTTQDTATTFGAITPYVVL